MARFWTAQFNAALGSLVVGVGAWLAWDGFSALGALLVIGATASFLLWRGRTVGLVWAWSTLFLGVECLIWPISTMVRIRLATSQPSDEEMGTMLSAVFMGLFSAVFWMAFSYGLFKRAVGEMPGATVTSSESAEQSQTTASSRPRKKR